MLAESMAQRGPRLGRPLVAFAIVAVATAAVLAGLWMSVDRAQSPRVVSFAGHSATLQPSTDADADADAAWIQAIFDKASASFAEADPGDPLYTVTLSLDQSGTAWRAELTMTPRTRDRTTHHEEIFGSSDDPGGFETKVTTHLTRDLQVLLDDERLAEMATWGTRNVHAYDLARQGDTFQVIETAESLSDGLNRPMAGYPRAAPMMPKTRRDGICWRTRRASRLCGFMPDC